MSDPFERPARLLVRIVVWSIAFMVLVTILYKIAFMKKTESAVNCLSAASLDERAKTRLQAVDGYAICVARTEKDKPKPGAPANPRCAYAGLWSSQREGVEYFVTLNTDGTFTAEPGRNTPFTEPPITGAWTVAGKTMVWAYDKGPVWPPDINPIINERTKTFSLREVNGEITQFLEMSRDGVIGC